MNTLKITKTLSVNFTINQDSTISVLVNYNNDVRHYFYNSVSELIENTSIVALKNYFN
jgi:hypothetical protein